MSDPFGLPTPETFRCGRCGNTLDGNTDEPVERRERDEARAQVERLREELRTEIEASGIHGIAETQMQAEIAHLRGVIRSAHDCLMRIGHRPFGYETAPRTWAEKGVAAARILAAVTDDRGEA